MCSLSNVDVLDHCLHPDLVTQRPMNARNNELGQLRHPGNVIRRLDLKKKYEVSLQFKSSTGCFSTVAVIAHLSFSLEQPNKQGLIERENVQLIGFPIGAMLQNAHYSGLLNSKVTKGAKVAKATNSRVSSPQQQQQQTQQSSATKNDAKSEEVEDVTDHDPQEEEGEIEDTLELARKWCNKACSVDVTHCDDDCTLIDPNTFLGHHKNNALSQAQSSIMSWTNFGGGARTMHNVSSSSSSPSKSPSKSTDGDTFASFCKTFQYFEAERFFTWNRTLSRNSQATVMMGGHNMQLSVDHKALRHFFDNIGANDRAIQFVKFHVNPELLINAQHNLRLYFNEPTLVPDVLQMLAKCDPQFNYLLKTRADMLSYQLTTRQQAELEQHFPATTIFRLARLPREYPLYSLRHISVLSWSELDQLMLHDFTHTPVPMNDKYKHNRARQEGHHLIRMDEVSRLKPYRGHRMPDTFRHSLRTAAMKTAQEALHDLESESESETETGPKLYNMSNARTKPIVIVNANYSNYCVASSSSPSSSFSSSTDVGPWEIEPPVVDDMLEFPSICNKSKSTSFVPSSSSPLQGNSPLQGKWLERHEAQVHQDTGADFVHIDYCSESETENSDQLQQHKQKQNQQCSWWQAWLSSYKKPKAKAKATHRHTHFVLFAVASSSNLTIKTCDML